MLPAVFLVASFCSGSVTPSALCPRAATTFFLAITRTSILLCNYIFSYKISQNQNTQYDPVPAEHFEIVLADISHEKFDGQDGNHKGHQHTGQQIDDLRTRKTQAEVDQF